MKLFGLHILRTLPEPRTVEVEKIVEKTLMGTPAPVTVYRVRDARYEHALSAFSSCSPYAPIIPGASLQRPVPSTWNGHYFASCAEAFAAHPEAKVESVQGWQVGDEFVTGLEVRKIILQPKPKKAKGK